MNYSGSFGSIILLFMINMINLLNCYIIQISTLSNTKIHHHFLLQIIEGGRKIIN
jgi:hypothetical protein